MNVIATQSIIIPYHMRQAFAAYHASKKRYNILVCHRRAGKTVAVINQQIKDILTCKRPNPRGIFLAPTFTQAKEIAWTYVKQFTRILPGIKYMEGELKCLLPNGGQIKLGGVEEIDRYRGQYFDSAVLDEFALMNPAIWTEVTRPAISDRQGRVTFIGTPKGQDAFYELYEYALEHPDDWFAMKLSAFESGILPPEELEANYKLMTPETYAREFEVDFAAAFPGAYYTADMLKAQEEGRIGVVKYDKAVPVYAALDLGIGDATAIWTVQLVANEWHFLNYYENSGKGLDHYITWLKGQNYPVDMSFLPHDARSRELSSGKSRLDYFIERNIKTTVLPKHAIEDGINAVRMMLNRAWFDKENCADGIKALKNYKTEFNGKTRALANSPLHDWSSHAADALRYGVMGLNNFYIKNRASDWKKPLVRGLKGIV